MEVCFSDEIEEQSQDYDFIKGNKALSDSLLTAVGMTIKLTENPDLIIGNENVKVRIVDIFCKRLSRDIPRTSDSEKEANPNEDVNPNEEAYPNESYDFRISTVLGKVFPENVILTSGACSTILEDGSKGYKPIPGTIESVL